MNRNPESIITLVARLELEFGAIESNFDLNRQAYGRLQQGADDFLDWAALGYTLHAIYTAMEHYFLLISKTFENDLSSDSWHKDLIDKMQLELPGIRPRLLSRALARTIDELRGFRHVFRSLYDDRLDPDRIMLIQKKIPDLRSGFSDAHSTFVESIQKLALG